MEIPRPRTCPFLKCDHGYPIDSTIKSERDHNRLYHLNTPLLIVVKEVAFTFRRDPSRQHKYVCVCGAASPNPSTFQYHVKGKQSSSRGVKGKQSSSRGVKGKQSPSRPPCSYICTRAADIVMNSITCEGDTQTINYRPAKAVSTTSNQEDADVAMMSEIDEEEDALLNANVSPDESVLSEHESQVDHDLNLDDSNANLRRILEDQHLLLGNTINQLQDTQNQLQDTQNQLQEARTVIESLLRNK
ncbi:MAG: hypothetical protein JOS17DRAFT_571080 [Linnemannia elongata]|nr:MAG: hypothetical protein JOS17DRAFT_571080 [Linnemannia elongata]